MPGGLEEFLRDMNQRLREKKGSSGSIPLVVDIKKRFGKTLGFFHVIAISLSCKLPARADGRNILKMSGNFPIKIEIGEDGLSASCDRLLRKFEDHHLSQLFQFPV